MREGEREIDTDGEVRPSRPVVRRRDLVALASVVAVVRIAFAAGRRVYMVAPDEAAVFGMARTIAGDTPWNMFSHSTWSPGFSVLAAPLFWFSDDPEVVYRAALVVNACLGGVGAALLALVAVRITRLRDRTLLVACALVASTPAAINSSGHMWAEPMVTISFLGCVLLTTIAVEERSVGAAIGAILTAAAGAAAHGRMLPLLAFVPLVLIAVAASRGERDRAAIIAGTAAATALAVVALTRAVVAVVWDEPGGDNTVGATLTRLTDVRGFGLSLAGQLWYLLASSFLIIGVGAVVLCRRALGSDEPAAGRARILIVLTVPLVMTSVVFMIDRTRADHQIYGRYNDAIMWPVMMVGIGWLVTAAQRPIRQVVRDGAAIVIATFACALILEVGKGEILADRFATPPMVAGIAYGRWMGTGIRPAAISLLAVAVFAGLVTIAIGSLRVLLPATALAVAVSSAAAYTWIEPLTNQWGVAANVREVREIVPPGEVIGFRFEPLPPPAMSFVQQTLAVLAYEWYLPDHRFERDVDDRDGVGPFVFGMSGSETLPAEGAVVVWRDPTDLVALWQEAG